MSGETRYRLDLAYVGTGFHGWQSQTSGFGIQDHLEKALATWLRHPVRVTAAARTDTGVHAQHQVVVFETSVVFDPSRLHLGINGLLPTGVRVTKVAVAPRDFHPILSSSGKAYRYRIWTGKWLDPFLTGFVWHLHHELDVVSMGAAAGLLTGTHDFSSFCASDSSAKTKVRTIHDIHIDARGSLIDVWVVGEGFLKQMVRNIVGTLVLVGQGKKSPAELTEILAARDRKRAGQTAPAQGLALVKIFYDHIATVVELQAEQQRGFAQALVGQT